jgi:hypothetical protein
MTDAADSAQDRVRSAKRAARYEATFRDANDQLARRRQELEVEEDRLPILCECEQERCTDLIFVRPEEYREARSSPRRFLVRDGHDPGARVVARYDGFAIVEKGGREGELVEEYGS